MTQDNEFKYNIGDIVSYYNVSNLEDVTVTITDMYVSRSTGVQRYILVDNSGYMYNSDESNIKPIPTKFKCGQTVRDKYSNNSNHRIGIVDSIISPGSMTVYYKVKFPDNTILAIEENQLTDNLDENQTRFNFELGQTVEHIEYGGRSHLLVVKDRWISSFGDKCYTVAYKEDNKLTKMYERELRDGSQWASKQPEPSQGQEDVTEKLIHHLKTRQTQGILTYGRSLETFNGRDALKDALDEALDMAQYIMQAILERDELNRLVRAQSIAITKLTEDNTKAYAKIVNFEKQISYSETDFENDGN